MGETETPVPGSCLCYDKCARKGGDQAGLTDAQAQTCFVDCVLRDGGWVFCPDGGGEEAAAVAPQPPKLDVVLSKHVRVAVTRPKVSRSRKEKEETEEVLVVEMGFGPDVHQISFLDVWLNTPEGKEKELLRNAEAEPQYAGMYVVHREDVVAGQDKAARKFRIGGKPSEPTATRRSWCRSLLMFPVGRKGLIGSSGRRFLSAVPTLCTSLRRCMLVVVTKGVRA